RRRRWRSAVSTSTGFNGAVDDSRRSRRRTSPATVDTPQGFNGAVDDSRRSLVLHLLHHLHALASMEPSTIVDGVFIKLCQPLFSRLASMEPSTIVDGVARARDVR